VKTNTMTGRRKPPCFLFAGHAKMIAVQGVFRYTDNDRLYTLGKAV